MSFLDTLLLEPVGDLIIADDHRIGPLGNRDRCRPRDLHVRG